MLAADQATSVQKFEPVDRAQPDVVRTNSGQYIPVQPGIARQRSNSAADLGLWRESPLNASHLRDSLADARNSTAEADHEGLSGKLFEVEYDGSWYPAVVQMKNSDGTYRVVYQADNTYEDVEKFRIKGLATQPSLSRQRSNSYGQVAAATAPEFFPKGGDLTPRAARFEILEWEVPGGPGAEERKEHECIRVAARFRPLNEIEKKEGEDNLCVRFGDDGRTCALSVDRTFGEKEIHFAYDHMFQPEATQQDVYISVAQPIVDGVINGFNGAIIAYGQTGSGKTHTMLGPSGAEAFLRGAHEEDLEELGIIPRALQALLDYSHTTEGQVQLRASYVEIYMERIIDLLSPISGGTTVFERESQKHHSAAIRDHGESLYLPEVTETPIMSVREALEVMRMGNVNRHMAETKMNRHSSRSHAVFIVTVTNSIDKSRQKFAQLYLVDLAGSERVKKTEVAQLQLQEAKQINSSLLALGQVIWALAHKQKHVPYRDSKLTMLLRNCLGGNARTAIMIAASPHRWNANESLSAMRFGARASLVQNAARVNVAEDPKELKRLLQRAREDLNELRGHCRRLQAEVAAFSAAEALPSRQLTVGGETPSAGVEMPLQGLTAKRLLVWGLLPSLVCPVNRAIMRDPVCAADGWTYERRAIERHFAQAGRGMPMSPVTGQRMCSRHLVPCHVVKQLINQHLPDLAPPEVRLPVIALLQVWLVMEILSYLDSKSLARSESAWPSFLAAADASQAWMKRLSQDFGKRELPVADAANDGEASGDGSGSPAAKVAGPAAAARTYYSELALAARKQMRPHMQGPAPKSKGLKLMKPPRLPSA